jgi:hypothetical protein
MTRSHFPSDFAFAFVCDFGRGRAGWLTRWQPGWEIPINVVSDVPRGFATVDEDGLVRVYRVGRMHRGAFKRWVVATFTGMNCNRVLGSWPHYRVEAVS